MSILQTIALGAIYVLATIAAIAGVIWLVTTMIDRVVTLTRFGAYLLQYARDRHGRSQARTEVEQREEIENYRRADRARVDYWQGRLNVVLIAFAKIMPKGFDMTMLGNADLTQSAVYQRCEELGIEPNENQPMINFGERDYKLATYAFSDFKEMYDKDGVSIPMDEIPRFRDMRLELDNDHRLLTPLSQGR
jgi:hypothetical protein